MSTLKDKKGIENDEGYSSSLYNTIFRFIYGVTAIVILVIISRL